MLAINEFKEALKLIPDDFQTQMLLVKVYSATCMDMDTLCNEALQFTSLMAEKYDTSAFVLEKRAALYMHLKKFTEADMDLKHLDQLKN